MTKGEEFHKELNNLLNLVKDNGLVTIAFAQEEVERKRLLNFMHTVTRLEIELKKSLAAYEADLSLEVIADDKDGVDLEVLAESGERLQTVKFDTND